MRKVVVFEWMSLDGVVQAPAYTDEDTSGGFKHGGWHLQYFEERSMKWVVETVSGAGGFLFGRRTYDVFAAHWPKASQEEQALARPLNALPKYVASRTLKEPLAWQNSMLLGDDVAESVAKLRRQDGKPLLVIGSTELVAALLAHDLVDEIRLMIDPVVLGGGKRFFRDDGVCRRLTLAASETTSTGAILATYARSSADTPVGASAVPLPRPPRGR
jgi:dihydrofolate reductase